MHRMMKSAVRIACEILAVGRRSFPASGSRTSRHDLTQAQLFALLMLRQFLQTQCRRLPALVAEWQELRTALELRKVPHEPRRVQGWTATTPSGSKVTDTTSPAWRRLSRSGATQNNSPNGVAR